MILVTLGTQDKSFVRLLEALEKEIIAGNITEEVVVQAGTTEFTSEHMKILDLIPYDEFSKFISTCDILITHGGVGSIITGLKNNKKVIAAARLKKYKEHANDHQKQIIETFKRDGYILELSNFNKISEVINEARKFKPAKYKSNTGKMIKYIEEYINN